MAFEPIEESRSQGEPVTLILFRYGEPENAFFAYTDAEQPITFDGIVYQPIPLDRDSVKSSGNLDKSGFVIRMPKSTELANLLQSSPPSETINVTVRQGHIGDTEFLVTQTGRMVSAKREGDELVSTVEPVSTSMKRPMIRRHYQYGCPHALYGPQCKASKAAATITRTAALVDGALVTLDANWDTEARRPKYVGGQLAWTLADGRTEVREIVAVSASTITIGYPGPELSTGTVVSITLGCNHQMSDCGALHNNILNFGGMPWIPTKNPIGIVNNFY